MIQYYTKTLQCHTSCDSPTIAGQEYADQFTPLPLRPQRLRRSLGQHVRAAEQGRVLLFPRLLWAEQGEIDWY